MMAWYSLVFLVGFVTFTQATNYNQQVVKLDPPDADVYIQGDSNVIEIVGGEGSNIIVQGDFNEVSQLDGANILTINGANNRISFRGVAGNHTITLSGSGNGVNFEGGYSAIYINEGRDNNITLRGEIYIQIGDSCSYNEVTVVEGSNIISVRGEQNKLTVLDGDNNATFNGGKHSVSLAGGSTDVEMTGDESQVWVVDDATCSITLIGSQGVIQSNAVMALGVLGNQNVIALDSGYSQISVTGDRNLVSFEAGNHILMVNGTYNEITAPNTEPTLDITVDGLLLRLGLPRTELTSFEYGGNTIRLLWDILNFESQSMTSSGNTGNPDEVTTPTLSNQAGNGEEYITPTKSAPNNGDTGNNGGGGYLTPTWAPFYTPSSRGAPTGGLYTPTPTLGGNLQTRGDGVEVEIPYVTPSREGGNSGGNIDNSGDNRYPLVTPRATEPPGHPNIDRLQAGNGGMHLAAWGKSFIALFNLCITMVVVWLMTSEC